MAKATRTSPQKPRQSGAEILITSERSSSQKLFGHLKGISFSFGCQEPGVLFWRANTKSYPRSTGPHQGAQDLIGSTRLTPLREGDLGVYCWLTPIWGWSASGSSSTSALYSSKASSSSGSPSSYRDRRSNSCKDCQDFGQKTKATGPKFVCAQRVYPWTQLPHHHSFYKFNRRHIESSRIINFTVDLREVLF